MFDKMAENSLSHGAVKLDITNLTDNEKLDPGCQIISIDVLHEINKIPKAEIKLLEDRQLGTFGLSGKDFFAPGKLWEIKVRYNNNPNGEEILFKGIIVRQCIKSVTAISYLIIELKSRAIALTSQQRTVVYQHCLDSDIIKNLASTVLETAEKDTYKTTVIQEQLVQHQCSDWDFMMCRADVNGLWIKIENEALYVFPPELAATPHHQFVSADSLKDNTEKPIDAMEITLDISQQVGQVTSYAWDPAEQTPIEKTADLNFTLQQGAFSIDAVAKQMGTEHFEQINTAPLPLEELSAWSNSKLLKSRLSLIRGYLTTAGFPGLRLGDTISLKNISPHCDGNTLVTGLRHYVNAEGWHVDVQFGMAADWFTERYSERNLSAAGLLPPTSGLQVGVVERCEKDEQGHYRVKVRLPLAGGDEPVIWARLASVYAGNKRGWYFYPEPDDEVVLGFFNNDPRQPVILGSMYSTKNVPPFEYSEENAQKGLVTKNGITILIDENQQGMQFATPEKKLFAFWDKGEKQGLFYSDEKHHQSITLDDKGMKITTEQSLHMESQNQVVIKGKKVDIQ